MPLFPLLREQFSGRGPVHIHGVPPWVQCPSMSAAEMTPTREMNTLFQEQSDLLKQISSAWERGDLNRLNRCLQECAVYFDPNKPHLLVYFVGLGGIDLFITLLCDVNIQKRLTTTTTHSLRSMGPESIPLWQLVKTLMTLMRVLTELLVCHNELGWYYYDRYPGLFFRLLELSKVTELRLTSLIMLEHLVLSVGPVLEISKIPILQELIRTDDDATLAILCRVIALLIVPGVVLNHRESPHQRLVYPESLLPLQRIQRVIDSNVLWLIGEKNFVKRLVMLCEVRGSGDIRAMMHNERPVSLLEGSLFEPVFRDLSTTAIAAVPLSLGGTFLPNNFFGGMDFLQMGLGGTPRPFTRTNNSNNNSNNNNTSGSSSSIVSGGEDENVSSADALNHPEWWRGRGYSVDEAISVIDDAVAQQRLGAVMGAWQDDETTSVASIAAVGSNVDFSWFTGAVDAKQRWRLRDLTLREEVDDNRPLLCGFGPVTDSKSCEAFRNQNQAFWKFLSPLMQGTHASYSPQIIVGAQSEILFVLNLMLSTFFFGDVWCMLRDCQWISAASRFYDAAFYSNSTDHSISPYVEELQRAPEFRQLPRFLLPGDCKEEMMVILNEKEIDEEKEEEYDSKNIVHKGNNDDDDDDGNNSKNNSKHQSDQSSRPVKLGEDTEAFIRHTTNHGIADDDDGFDDKNHQHEPSTIRKLELLRGVQEFWNAQDRRECSMLHEGDTVEQSAPLALKIAKTLAQQNEDSCVETSACHALEGYLRCFSFSVYRRNAPDSPQTILGNILMRSILEHRVYNATYVPGLSGSLSPSKRIDSFFALLGELIRYHHGNLLLLQSYVTGAVSLLHLNNPSAASLLHAHHARDAATESTEEAPYLPPLDRGEYEPFANVLLRRMYRHGCDTNLFLRSLILSFTPNLRSKINYIWKPVTPRTADVKGALDGVARIGDVVTGHPDRLSYIGRHSRQFVAILSGVQQMRRKSHDSNTIRTETIMVDRVPSTPSFSSRSPVSDLTQPPPPTFSVSSSTSTSTTLTLWDMLQILLRSPHRLALENRPFPHFFDDYDRAVVMGEIELPPIGPPPEFVVPLFPEMTAGTSGGDLSSLAGLEKALLQEPHKLVYSMLGPLNAERLQNAGRLCVVTTCILVFVRAACLGGAGAVHEILQSLKPLAVLSYEKWKRQRNTSNHCARRWAKAGRHINSYEDSCYCRPGDGPKRCSAFLLHGHCAPVTASEEYYRNYGGCFYRNMFRLMCVWIGHYGACQRYVETVYYCTEVPFAETKCVVLYLMRILPDYFL